VREILEWFLPENEILLHHKIFGMKHSYLRIHPGIDFSLELWGFVEREPDQCSEQLNEEAVLWSDTLIDAHRWELNSLAYAVTHLIFSSNPLLLFGHTIGLQFPAFLAVGVVVCLSSSQWQVNRSDDSWKSSYARPHWSFSTGWWNVRDYKVEEKGRVTG
jgi:hypothetical protein